MLQINHFEPLEHYLKSCNYNSSLIKKLVVGERYTAVFLNNGNIGVCANLNNSFGSIKSLPDKIDLSEIHHRIIYIAYLNALFNYENKYEEELDIFSAVDFSQYHNSVMIGYFKPLVKKFDETQIKLTVYDIMLDDERLASPNHKDNHIQEADCLIVTATTIMNKTLWDVLSLAAANCNIYLLGPSAIMHKDIFEFTNIKAIFGTVFEKNDDRVLQLIEEGYGTRDFQKFGKKVVFRKS